MRRIRVKKKRDRQRKFRRPREGEAVLLVNDSWANNHGLVPAIRKSDYESFTGIDSKGHVDRNGDSIKISIPNKITGIFLGHIRVKLGRPEGKPNEYWGLTGGYHVLVGEVNYVIQPGYVSFILDHSEKYGAEWWTESANV